jgi:hypothetical protein
MLIFGEQVNLFDGLVNNLALISHSGTPALVVLAGVEVYV